MWCFRHSSFSQFNCCLYLNFEYVGFLSEQIYKCSRVPIPIFLFIESNRLVEVGQVAGTALHCPPVLRSSGLEIYGCSAGTAPIECVMEAIPQLVELAASGKLSVDVETIPLAEVESAWQRPVFDNRRLVFVP